MVYGKVGKSFVLPTFGQLHGSSNIRASLKTSIFQVARNRL